MDGQIALLARLKLHFSQAPAEQTNAAPEIKGELVYQATITRAEDISLFFINAGCSTGWRPKNIKELPV